MARLSLLDVVRPYFFVAMDLGPGVQDVLGLLHVDSYDAAWDDDGVVISGVARIDSDNPSSPVFSPFAGGAQPAGGSSASVWDFHDVAIRFRLTAARQPGAALDASTLSDANLQAAIAALGPATGPARSDAPGTQFRLDLMFELVSFTIPRLRGGKLQGHLLVPDPANPTVRLQLPRILLVVTQDSASDTGVAVDVASWGAETIDDADPAIASLIRMTPTYALVNDYFGFGFEKAVLDLSATKTPPDLLDRFGIGDDFKGLYLPEVRIFATTQKSAGTAFNVGARECLISFGSDIEIWGDFNIDIDRLGDRLDVGIRLYGVDGSSHDPTLVKPADGDPPDRDRYQVTVPSTAGPETESYVLFLDVRSGAAPFRITAVHGLDHPANLNETPDDAFFDDPANDPEDISASQRVRLFSHDQRAVIRVTSSNPLQRRVIVLDVFPDRQTQVTTKPQADPLPEAKWKDVTPAKKGSVTTIREEGLDVLLRIEPPDGALTADGAAVPVTNGDARVRVAEGATVEIDVAWATTGEILGRLHAYFELDRPRAGEKVKPSAHPKFFRELNTTELKRIWDERATGSAPTIRVDGYASRQTDPNPTHNRELSRRRADQLAERIAEDLGVPPGEILKNPWGQDGHPPKDPTLDERLVQGHVPGNRSANEAYDKRKQVHYEPSEFQVAVASVLAPSSGDTFSGKLFRKERRKVEQAQRLPEPRPPQGRQPRFLRHIGGTIRLERDRVAAFEARLTVDFQTAHEEGLERFRNDIDAIRPGLEDPQEGRLPTGNPNPEDGVVELRYAITHDLATGGFTHTLVGRAAAADRDGLWSWGEIPAADAPGEPEFEAWRDLVGLYFTLAPLLSATAADAAAGGEIVPLGVVLATPVLITALGEAHVLRFTHYGVELVVRHDEDEVHATLMFDVESAIWLNLKIGDGPSAFEIATTRLDKPIKVRYRAVGFALDAVEDQPVRFLPAFDSSRGYTIDLADSGSLRVLPALGDTVGDIVQILGARIARTNPLNLEVDLGLGVDLGVFTVDTFGFRLPLDPPGPPTITAIGIGVDIPGAVTGSGYLQIFEDGFAGQLDLQLTGVGLRIAGGLAVRTVTEGDRSATGVLATLAVEFPGGIPLGGTGLAIFGFLGLFAMHHRRLEDETKRIPALDWHVNVAQGDPTRLQAWGPALDAWAFGVGLVAGTVEGGTVLNLKGMLALELPGPRVVLFANANLLKKKPKTKGTEAGSLLAVVDISPQRVLIGVQVEYLIGRKDGLQVLELRVPAGAGFFYDPPEFRQSTSSSTSARSPTRPRRRSWSCSTPPRTSWSMATASRTSPWWTGACRGSRWPPASACRCSGATPTSGCTCGRPPASTSASGSPRSGWRAACSWTASCAYSSSASRSIPSCGWTPTATTRRSAARSAARSASCSSRSRAASASRSARPPAPRRRPTRSAT